MLAKVACRAGVPSVEIASNELQLAVAMQCPTLKDMGLVAFNIFNGGRWFEEDVDRSVPLLCNVI